jgi:hypothetical protein
MLLKTFKYTFHDKLFFWFEILLKCEKKYEKKLFGDFFILRKKTLDFQKIKNYVVTFPSWFWFVKKNLNV